MALSLFCSFHFLFISSCPSRLSFFPAYCQRACFLSSLLASEAVVVQDCFGNVKRFSIGMRFLGDSLSTADLSNPVASRHHDHSFLHDFVRASPLFLILQTFNLYSRASFSSRSISFAANSRRASCVISPPALTPSRRFSSPIHDLNVLLVPYNSSRMPKGP